MYNQYGFPGNYVPQVPSFGQLPQFPNQAPNVYQPTTQNAQAQSMPTVLQVSTIKQVEQAPVQPGGKALVLVANEPVIAMRTADNMGLTTTDYYRIERFDPDAVVATQNVEYATRAELQQAIESITQQLKQMTSASTPTTKEKEVAKK